MSAAHILQLPVSFDGNPKSDLHGPLFDPNYEMKIKDTDISEIKSFIE